MRPRLFCCELVSICLRSRDWARVRGTATSLVTDTSSVLPSWTAQSSDAEPDATSSNYFERHDQYTFSQIRPGSFLAAVPPSASTNFASSGTGCSIGWRDFSVDCSSSKSRFNRCRAGMLEKSFAWSNGAYSCRERSSTRDARERIACVYESAAAD